jgi:hypothetical protein
MFDKLNFMSVVDLMQLVGKGKKVFGGLFGGGGHKEEENKPASSEIKGDENLPTGLLSEKFTRVDESYWQLLMTHLDAPVAKTLRALEKEMDQRDDADSGSRIDSFRIGVLIMPNKVGEEVVTESAPEKKKKREEKQPEEAKTVTRKVDPRFTDNDARVVYLKYLAGLVEAEMKMPGGKNEADAITTVINYLEADKFLVTGETLQRAKALAEKAADTSFEEVLRFRLGKEEYDDIKNRHPLTSETQLRELRLCALRVLENYRTQELKTGKRKNLTGCNQRAIAVLIIIFVIVIISGLIYGYFAK